MPTLSSGVYPKNSVTLADVIRKAERNRNYRKAGAVAMFIGTVRSPNGNRQVTKLELQAYEEQANKTLQAICRTLKRRDGITDVQIYHLLGEFKPGEALVYVLVAGTHRHCVFPVLQEAVERYKKEAPIFKREHTTDRKGRTRAAWTSEKKLHNAVRDRARP